MKKFSLQLRQLVDEYYHQQITVDDYRTQRKQIFDQIELEMDIGQRQEMDGDFPE